METIQDRLREEARDYQDLSRMQYQHVWRMTMDGRFAYKWFAAEQDKLAYLSRIARSALFELIGAESEAQALWPYGARLSKADLAS